MLTKWLGASFCMAVLVGDGGTAYAITITDYKKQPYKEQAVYVDAAVSMMAYYHGGDKSSCIYDWFFRTKESGPEVVRMLSKAEDKDPQLHVEGVLLGLIKRHCGHLDEKDGSGAPR